MTLDELAEAIYPEKEGTERLECRIYPASTKVINHAQTPEGVELRLLTQNMWMIPRPFAADNKKRLERFAEYVRKKQPDVVAVQELWLRWSIDYLREQIGYHCIASDSYFNRTGLALFLRERPISAGNYAFPKNGDYNFVETLAAKGFQKAKVRINGNVVTVINCHLYNPTRPFEDKITAKQFRKLIKAAEGDTILMGDLNLSWDDFVRENDGFFHHDGNNELTLTRDNPYQNMRFNKYMKSGFKDDYLLLRPVDMKVKSWETRVVKNPIVSDHWGVVGRLKLE